MIADLSTKLESLFWTCKHTKQTELRDFGNDHELNQPAFLWFKFYVLVKISTFWEILKKTNIHTTYPLSVPNPTLRYTTPKSDIKAKWMNEENLRCSQDIFLKWLLLAGCTQQKKFS